MASYGKLIETIRYEEHYDNNDLVYTTTNDKILIEIVCQKCTHNEWTKFVIKFG